MLRIDVAPKQGILPCDVHQVAHFAKVINPLLSVEARGRFAGLVYNTWRGISTVKAHSGPNQPNSAKQLYARALLTTITAEWRALTQGNRDAWAVYADNHLEADWTGNPVRLTAQNWYMRCSIQLNRMGESSIATPPAVAAPDAVVGFNIQKTVDDLTQTFTGPIGGTAMLDTRRLGPVSTGVDPKIEHAINVRLVNSDVQQPDIIYASVPNGRYRAWVKVIATATGLTSTWQSKILDIA